MNSAYWLNTAWMIGCSTEAAAFERDCHRVEACQRRVLRRLLQANRRSEFGRQHGFERIDSVDQFQAAVPVRKYDGFRERVARVAKGESHVLTEEPVRLLEPTSGSTSGEKLICYTDSLRSEFQRALSVWTHDLLRHRPAVRRGRAYWSISPSAQANRVSEGGIPIGFQHDCEYLSRWQQWAVSRLLIAPDVRSAPSVSEAHYQTLLSLAAAEDLAFVSVWSPTFWIGLMEVAERRIDSLCRDLRDGAFGRPAMPERADQLEHIWSSQSSLEELVAATWPQLALISCWADASSSPFANQLRQLMPRSEVQPKGLLSTEGVISIPLTGCGASAAAIRSHYLEFIDADDESRVRQVDEVESGSIYRVVITTGGGLYRYDTGDLVEVTGRHHQCPLLRFVGRAEAVSDLVGEKLHEPHVGSAIAAACRARQVNSIFAMLGPIQSSSRPHYQLRLETTNSLDLPEQAALLDRLESSLRDNPHYRFARETQQLGPLQLELLPAGAWERYQKRRLEQGLSLGDIKPTALDTTFDTATLGHESSTDERTLNR